MHMSSRIWTRCGWSLAALVLLPLGTTVKARAADADVGPDPKEVQAVIDKAAAYIKKKQATDGSFPVRGAGPGVTALVVAGYLRNGFSADDPVVAKAITA